MENNTHLVCIFSDVHFDNEHKTAWSAFRQWHKEHKPSITIANGDIVDLGMLSRYEQSADDPVYAIDQIKIAVEQLNELDDECGRLIYVPGNHGERWEKAIFGTKAQALKGAAGMTLREQMYAQGLKSSIKWVQETSSCPGVYVGKKAVLVRHGHKQAGGWGIKNIAAGHLAKFPTVSTVVGHHHRAQLMGRTSLGKTVVAIANPHLSGDHDYNTSPDWQRGFTILEFYGRKRLRDCVDFTPQVVIMDEKGRFAYNGKVYGG
jgi:predicted phosphodiesterase